MPLRSSIIASPEVLSDLLQAADDRFREAEALLLESEYDGSVYLFGYAVEMWLKVACFRLQGLGPVAPVKAALAPLKNWMKIIAPSVAFVDYHDLSFFAECVFNLRANVGRPLSGSIAADLRSMIINGLHTEWIVEMRYRRSRVSGPAAWDALGQAWWMKNHWIQLT